MIKAIFKTIIDKLFPVTYSEKEIFIQKLNNYNYISEIEYAQDTFEFTYKGRINLQIRNWDSSDILVFDQVFILQEYSIVRELLSQLGTKEINIIDAGANIGLTTLYLLEYLPQSNVALIEPDRQNLKILINNLSKNQDLIKYSLFPNALSSKLGKQFKTVRSFRDANDWAVTTVEATDGEVFSITVDEIISSKKWQIIDLLKIDIEGAEAELFSDPQNLKFLEKVKILAIEIHDEFNCRQLIEDTLKSFGFLIFHSGELTIGVNLKIAF